NRSYPSGLAQAPLWGLGRVAANEHGELWGGMVDLDPHAAAEDQARQLFAEIWQREGEPQVAWRQQQRYVARLVRAPALLSPAATIDLRDDASYLISGGLGGLGLALARWLVGRGARHLVLVGRSQPGATAMAAIRELEQAGATLLIAQADVGVAEQTAEL